jgi:hypothetical protein
MATRAEVRSFGGWWVEAHEAGMKAAAEVTPTPMVVRGYAPVEGGVCGFAWVKFPGVGKFAAWAKRTGRARKGWPKGLTVWVSEFGQSMTRKEAYARAFAAVLREKGVEAYAESRMD